MLICLEYIVFDSGAEPIHNPTICEVEQFMFWKIDPATGKIELSVQEKKSNIKDYVVMQAMIFPYINILWMGCIIMFLGTLLAIWERIKRSA